MARQTMTGATYTIVADDSPLQGLPDGTTSIIMSGGNRVGEVITYRFWAEPKANLAQLPLTHELPWRNRKRFKRSQRSQRK